jgi:PGM1 C-terminal domain
VHAGTAQPVAIAGPDRLGIGLPESELQTRFEALQRRLVAQWARIEAFTDEPTGIVVVPSISDIDLELDSNERQAYEERFLFLLFLLRQPRAELVYVTSQPIQPSVIDYYLGLLPGIVASHARRRLHLVSPHDGSPSPLSAKLIERPRLLDEIRSIAGDPDRAHLVAYNTTQLERDLALLLGIPMFGADPKFRILGTKSGGRALFAEVGVPGPEGREGLRSVDDVIDAVLELVAARPGVESLVLKHDAGLSGHGNAILDVRGLAGAGRPAVERRLSDLRPEDADLTPERFLDRIADGGVVEELIVGRELRSPSVQMRVTPLGKVELLSTHDQLLEGQSGQSFVGSVFPASDEYAREIADEALKVGSALAARGVIGRFAVDFLTARTDRGWRVYAIELNLRKGGTTHPYLTLQFLTDGAYHAERALFLTPTGKPKFFVSTDRLQSDAYRVLQPHDVFDVAVRNGLHFDHTTETGAVFHMMTALGWHGLIGLTAVGDTREQARALFERTRGAFDNEARAASVDQGPLSVG